MAGYSSDDKFILGNNGQLTHYNVGNQILDTLGAVIYSVELEADVGIGVGTSVSIYSLVEADLVAKACPLAVYMTPFGIDIGARAELGTSAKMINWDLYNLKNTSSYSYLSGESLSSISEEFVVGLSFGVYKEVGFNVGFGWNISYISEKFTDIWF